MGTVIRLRRGERIDLREYPVLSFVRWAIVGWNLDMIAAEARLDELDELDESAVA